MSEGKKTLLVVEDLDRLLLCGQLTAMGLDIDVIVDNNSTGVMGSMITGLLSSSATREETLAVLRKRDYSGDYRADTSLLLEKIAKEFNDFCVFHKFQALRDSTIGKLNYALSQGPDSGGNPALQDSQREASVSINAFDKAHDLMRKTLVEMLDELKGIKAAVTPATLVDFGLKERMETSSELREFLSTPQLSMPELIEGLRAHFTSPQGAESVVRWPSNKAEFVDLVTKAISDTTGNRELPSISLTQLSDKARMDIVRLLNPSFSVSLHGHYNANIEPFDTGAIFAALLKGLDDGSGIVNFYGLNTLSDHDKGTLRHDLQRVIGKQSIKVAGHTKETFVDGLSRALTQAIPPNTEIVIQGIGYLDKESTRDLFNLLNTNLEGTSTSIWHQTNTRAVLEKLIESIGGNEVGTVTLHDLKCIDPRVKRNLHAALKTALEKYDELNARDKKVYVAGEEHLPKEVTEGNMARTLGIFTNLWAQAALEKGIELDQSSLLNHLLKQGAANLTNITGVDIVIGNHTLSRNKDGSLKIVTQLPNNTVSFVVLGVDGAVMLHGPGYMG